MGSVLGVVGEGVDCAPCIPTLSTGKEGLMALRIWVPNFLLLAALNLGFFFRYRCGSRYIHHRISFQNSVLDS